MLPQGCPDTADAGAIALCEGCWDGVGRELAASLEDSPLVEDDDEDSPGKGEAEEKGPITLDGVQTQNGDYLIGDVDGVVIIPADALEDTLRLGTEKVDGESTVRVELSEGLPVAEVFRRHGIL